MKEYIEREAAIAFMNEVEPCICHDPDGAIFTATKDSNMLEFLRAIPAADVVPVARCGECKWSDNYGLDLMCQKHSGITKNRFGEDIHFVEWHSKNFFCSDGTRKGCDGE